MEILPEILARKKAFREGNRKHEAYLNRSQGVFLENLLRLMAYYEEEGNTEQVARLQSELVEYDAMTPQEQAMANLFNLLGREALKRSGKAFGKAWAARVQSQTGPDWKAYFENEPARVMRPGRRPSRRRFYERSNVRATRTEHWRKTIENRSLGFLERGLKLIHAWMRQLSPGQNRRSRLSGCSGPFPAPKFTGEA
ncbi:MAG: hypothetical protein M2R45_04746 [Verrucomicrobia subdivision 3 bacterium]|nr:hypothetical protein [Limisphaerales bacterium]MCS1415766.1 hypothetical protein [Limisphaerales bacterium]